MRAGRRPPTSPGCGSSASACRRRSASFPTSSARRSSSPTTAASPNRSSPSGWASRSARSRAGCSPGLARLRELLDDPTDGDAWTRDDPRPDRRLRARRARAGRAARPSRSISRVRELPRGASPTSLGRRRARVRGRARLAAAGAARPHPRGCARRAAERRPAAAALADGRSSRSRPSPPAPRSGSALWNVSLHNQLSSSQSEALTARAGQRAPRARWSSRSSGSAALVVDQLDAAPTGKTYEAWVIRGANAAAPAGLFHGGQARPSSRSSGWSKRGAVVAVTVEPAGGSRSRRRSRSPSRRSPF